MREKSDCGIWDAVRANSTNKGSHRYRHREISAKEIACDAVKNNLGIWEELVRIAQVTVPTDTALATISFRRLFALFTQ